MKVIVVLPCKNQDEIVRYNIDRLINHQDRVPDNIVVVEDHSDSFDVKETDIVKVVLASRKGRSSTRNLGIETAMSMGADLVIFMDGDSVPEHEKFISNYIDMYPTENPWAKFVFGTRKHVERPIEGSINKFFDQYQPRSYEKDIDKKNLDPLKNKVPLSPQTRREAHMMTHQYNKQKPKSIKMKSIDVSKYPSDLLTGNMDRIVSGVPIEFSDLDNRDLRVIAGVTNEFNKMNHEEKVDMVISGMVTWSCNFAVNRTALEQLKSHNAMVHGRGFYFDDDDFNTGWGYEDVALGLDALYAGVDIITTTACDILHFVHERSDELMTHIVGKHKIMDRYRKLYKNRIMNAIRDVK